MLPGIRHLHQLRRSESCLALRSTSNIRLAFLLGIGCTAAPIRKPDPATNQGTDSADPCIGEPSECNGIDDDCDGLVDEPSEPPMAVWYPDDDGDGFGDPTLGAPACAPPTGHVWPAGDCDDADATTFPGAWDRVGDGIDQDCDGRDATCDASAGARNPWVGDLELASDDATATLETLCAQHDGIDGQVVVRTTDWIDLRPMGCLCSITGGLVVETNFTLETLAGLPPGRSIGRVLEITGNAALTSTEALASTHWTTPPGRVERLVVEDNPQLTQLTGFDGWQSLDLLQVRRLDALSAFSGPDDLRTVLESLEIRDNPVLEQVSGFAALQSAAELRLEGNPQLANLEPFRALKAVSYLTLGGNALHDLAAFASLQAIDGRLTIRDAPVMTSPAGLVALERLGGLRIENNPSLTSLEGLADASAAEGIRGDVELHANLELTDLAGLDWVRWVDGDLVIGGTDALTPLQSLTGLEQVTFVTGSVVIQRVLALETLAGLDNLQEAGGLRIDGTDQPGSTPFALTGVPRLHTLHGTLDVRNHPSVRDLSGLSELSMIGDLVLLDNPRLLSLDGLDGLRTADDLIALRNPRLTDVGALSGLESFGDICLEVPGSASEPQALLDLLGATERCP